MKAKLKKLAIDTFGNIGIGLYKLLYGIANAITLVLFAVMFIVLITIFLAAFTIDYISALCGELVGRAIDRKKFEWPDWDKLYISRLLDMSK